MPQKNAKTTQNTEHLRDASSVPPSDHAHGNKTNSTNCLDFLTDDFNRIDELDDNVGNYREFESLEGVVTSDMRYHEKRKTKKHADSDPVDTTPEATDREYSNETVEEQSPPQPLTIVSRGRLLIVGQNSDRMLDCAEYLRQRGMNCTLCVVDSGMITVASSTIDAFPLIEAGSVAIDGSFGGFRPDYAGTGNRQSMVSGPAGQHADFFDLVLDLQTSPSYTGRQLPLGYYAPGQSPELIQEAMDELVGMRGRFRKPQLTVLKKNRCLNGRSRFRDCRRCIEICPFSAIMPSAKERGITLDQYRCQGCGWCAMVCPADAIELQNPRQEELLSQLMSQLSEWRGSALHAPRLFLHDGHIDGKGLHQRIVAQTSHPLLVEVDEIGRIGAEVLLLALVNGAAGVSVVYDKDLPEELQEPLAQQVRLSREILEGLGLPGEFLSLMRFSSEPTEQDMEDFGRVEPEAQTAAPPTQFAAFPLDADRRQLIRQAAEFLKIHYHAEQMSLSLSEDAPFGTISIDESCSFCMACVGACPSGALSTGGATPLISMVESLCHQCSFCADACPENAIKLQPRLLLDCLTADMPTVLREEEPFTCVECGKAFASKKMIDRMREKLNGHWMYSTPRQLRRLQMCRSCRTHDALAAGDFRT